MTTTVQLPLVIETWEQKAKRLVTELHELKFDAFKSTPKQREAYWSKRYELQLHLASVAE